MMTNMALCTIRAEQLLNDLREDRELSQFRFPAGKLEHFCFRVDLPPDADAHQYGISTVSISVPLDAMGNRLSDGVSATNLPSTLEIAMVGRDGSLSYAHPQCSDILRFYEYKELVETLVMLVKGFPSEDEEDF